MARLVLPAIVALLLVLDPGFVASHGFGARTSLARSPGVSTLQAQQQEFDVRTAGQIGGGISAVAVEGNLVYLAVGPRLLALDAGPLPASLVQVASSAFAPDPISALAVSGGYAYLVGEDGLHVVEVSPPERFREVAHVELANASHVAVLGKHAYVLAEGLQIVDVSQPDRPRLVGTLDTARGNGIAADERYVYVTFLVPSDDPGAAPIDGGVQVIDISDPGDPREIGRLELDAQPRAVSAAGGYAYVASTRGLSVVAAVPEPREAGFIEAPDGFRGVAVSGDHAYVLADGIGVIEVADPEAPQQIASLETGTGLERVVVAAGYAYVVDTDRGLLVADISDPTAPREVAIHKVVGPAVRAAVAGRFAYVASSGTLWIADLSNSASSRYVGRFQSPEGFGRLAVADGRVLLTEAGTGLRVVDVADPTSPREVGLVPLEGIGNGDIVAGGRYVHIAVQTGLSIVDLAGPGTPREVGSLRTSHPASRLAVAGNRAYLATDEPRIVIVDIADPRSPREVGSIPMSRPVRALGTGRYLYVGSSFNGLQVFDVAVPEHPRELGASVDRLRIPQSIAEIDGHVVVLDLGVLWIFNLSAPDLPRRAAAVVLPVGIEGVLVGNRAYVANFRGGLRLVEFRPHQANPSPGTVLLEDNFDDPVAGRLSRVVFRPEHYRFGYEGGEYLMARVDTEVRPGPLSYLPGKYTDTSLAVDVRLSGETDDRYVILFCRVQDTESGYWSLIDPGSQRFWLGRSDSGEDTLLTRPSFAAAIHGGNESNRLELTCAGSTISLAINGVQAATVQDETYREGRLALQVGAFSESTGTVEAHFDDLVVTQAAPPGSSPTVGPTPTLGPTPGSATSGPSPTPGPTAATGPSPAVVMTVTPS